MNRLIEIGFEVAGHWKLDGENLLFELLRHASRKNVLYAFVSDGEVKYVGKTDQPLKSRMAGYKNPGATQSTNIKNNRKISELLRSGAAVDILALPDNGQFHYGRFHLNLAAGLERSIIDECDPQWNRPAVKAKYVTTNRDSNSTFDASEEEPQLKRDSEDIAATERLERMRSFGVILQPTYARTGFFNVVVKHKSLFGNDGEKIDISCAGAEQPIVGTINRTANGNRTPRIIGGKGLRDWFAKHVAAKQEFIVVVISPTEIQIKV